MFQFKLRKPYCLKLVGIDGLQIFMQTKIF